MKLNSLSLVLTCAAFLSGCGVLPQETKASTAGWQEKEGASLEQQKKAETTGYLRQLSENKSKQQTMDLNHPEVSITGLGNIFSEKKAQSLRYAYNAMPFVTRNPGTSNSQQVYVNIENYKLSLQQVNNSVRDQLTECKRITAYSGYDIESACFEQVGKELSHFAAMLKDPKIPDLTKKAALGEATYGSYIDFEHAVRLAKMHTKLCEQQGNEGYVTMETIAAPCKGFKGA